MNILALDLGTKTGWAKLEDGQIFSGWQDNKGGRFEGGGMRYLHFKRFLSEAVPPGAVDMVVYEEVRRHVATDAAHVYGGMMATLSAYCEENSIPYQSVPVGTIKKHATGKGNASKDAMLAAMQAKHGPQVTSEDEADALALLGWAMENWEVDV